jgi:hypothetical protein
MRGRSSGFIDQYQSSSAPTSHGAVRQPYHPLSPRIVGYSVRPSTVRAWALTASIIARHASAYF